MSVASPYNAWRNRARALLQRGVPPESSAWDGDAGLFNDKGGVESSAELADGRSATPVFRVPPRVVDLLDRVACHRDPRRHALMYRLLWRVTHGEHELLQDAADDDVVALTRMAKAVDRSAHKMTAFVRFRELQTADGPRYMATFEPEHDVLVRTAPHFVKRFGTMVWTIATSDGVAHWDRNALTFFEVDAAIALPTEDAAETLWLTYYDSIFNPARLNVAMMRKEMPVAYWKNLPEAARIPALVAEASARAGKMIASTIVRDVPPYVMKRRAAAASEPAASAPDALPAKKDLDACRRCPLGVPATQAVAGEGPLGARIVLVGEQPGDEEDLAGKPFIGPAGRLLRRALVEAGIDARSVYITNAVKHFSYEPRGKRRIHKTPSQREIEVCGLWLDAELAALKPSVIVALGGSALFATMRQKLKVGEARGRELTHYSGARVIATYHPSAVLRAIDDDQKASLQQALIEDLRRAAALAERSPA